MLRDGCTLIKNYLNKNRLTIALTNTLQTFQTYIFKKYQSEENSMEQTEYNLGRLAAEMNHFAHSNNTRERLHIFIH